MGLQLASQGFSNEPAFLCLDRHRLKEMVSQITRTVIPGDFITRKRDGIILSFQARNVFVLHRKTVSLKILKI